MIGFKVACKEAINVTQILTKIKMGQDPFAIYEILNSNCI